MPVDFFQNRRVLFFSSRSRHTRSLCDWSSDVCSSDLPEAKIEYTLWLTGSATTGPAVLLNVALPVVGPAPVIASPTRVQVKPSSSERCTRISDEFFESW